MSNNLKMFLFVVAIVVLVTGGLIFAASRNHKNEVNTVASDESGTVAGASTQTQDAGYIERLAKFMSAKGMVMYGADWCTHCKAQKALFGDAWKFVDYVECDPQSPNANPDECIAKQIQGYPTWIYQGQLLAGQKTLAELAGIVGFTDQASDTTSSTTP